MSARPSPLQRLFRGDEQLGDVLIPLTRYSIEEYVVTGVYFLFKGATLIYVGQSVNVLGRIGQHRADGKDFDAFTFIRCSKAQLIALETACIRLFCPTLNGVQPAEHESEPTDTGPAFLRIKAVSILLGVSGPAVRKLIREGHIDLTPVKIGAHDYYRRADVLAQISNIGKA